MANARVTEISSTPPTSFEDAVTAGLDRAHRTLRGVTGARVKEKHVRLEGGAIAEYRVHLLVTFVLDT